ncbi:PD-(D/E)XK nuclease-like domain-containing protein [Lysinibacillus fusiformis]|uniref:PD-(D/E)XK nuclease-like domain-containing protein n=1 Tax=Lysinibacillus fusiformis TaxID=28031 RepID=UPI0037994855
MHQTTFQLSSQNYHSNEANQQYMSVSQFKSAMECEARTFAEVRGEFSRPPSTALLVGSYLHAAFEIDTRFSDFIELNHNSILNNRGKKYKDYEALVYEAMKITALQQPNKPMQYTGRILANWRTDFITNVEQLKAKEEREKNKRQQSSQSSYQKSKGRTEVVPEWFANRNDSEEPKSSTDTTSNTIDFEAERQKVLEMLGKKESVSNG